ncbi:MAG: class I SAM-dependent methyltransferase [Nitrospirota bacterium]
MAQAAGGRELLRCERCGLLAPKVVPDPAELLRWYRDGYWSRYQAEQQGPARDNLYRHVLDLIQRFRSHPGTLVDVGCGMGALLKQARDRGWRAIGFELSLEAVAQARAQGLEVYESAWPPCALPDESADVVVFLNVLDHLPSPFAAIEEARRVLRAGGLLYVRVPNGPLHVRLGRLLSAVGLPDVTVVHLYGFGKRAFAHHLPRFGFTTVAVRTAPPSRGDAYQDGGAVRGAVRRSLKRLDRLVYALSASLGLDRAAWGPSIEVMASKDRARRSPVCPGGDGGRV